MTNDTTRYEAPKVSDRRELVGELGEIQMGSGYMPDFQLSSR